MRFSRSCLVTLFVWVIPCLSSEGDSCEFGSQKYLILCGFGGILSCGTTHTAVVPLDLVKCRMQVCVCVCRIHPSELVCVNWPRCTPSSACLMSCCDAWACVCSPRVTESGDSCEFGSMKYYALCGFGGILSCGLTHTAVVPLDLVKCRLQVCAHLPIIIITTMFIRWHLCWRVTVIGGLMRLLMV